MGQKPKDVRYQMATLKMFALLKEKYYQQAQSTTLALPLSCVMSN